MGKVKSRLLRSLGSVLLFLALGFGCILFSPDPASSRLRTFVEAGTNSYIKNLADRASMQALTSTDKLMLKMSIGTGVAVSKFKYPEASTLLSHYLHGDGSDLELDSNYFSNSAYLQSIIEKLGRGNHGPLTLRQSDDWRLSLALNPYYLNVTAERIRIYHPKISFAPVDSERVYTIVPLGKLNLRVYDNLVSVMSPKSFYVYSEWQPSSVSD